MTFIRVADAVLMPAGTVGRISIPAGIVHGPAILLLISVETTTEDQRVRFRVPGLRRRIRGLGVAALFERTVPVLRGPERIRAGRVIAWRPVLVGAAAQDVPRLCSPGHK